jgi:hypothetical protein
MKEGAQLTRTWQQAMTKGSNLQILVGPLAERRPPAQERFEI